DSFVLIDPALYTIDYKNGSIEFLYEFGEIYDDEGTPTEMETYTRVSADYQCKNMQIVRRKYAHNMVKAELLLKQSDSVTFILAHRNIATRDDVEPKIFLFQDGQFVTIPPSWYTIDYRNGVVTFLSPINANVYADYTYFDDEVLTPLEIDFENGRIYLTESIDFTDEIYVSYSYYEEFIEYKGYWDGTTYHYLDLNPSEGHQSVIPAVDTANDTLINKLLPSSKLIGDMIYIYLLPSKEIDNQTGAITNRPHCIRHCFGSSEMARIKYQHPEALILGVVQVQESTTANDTIALDTRSRGGGLKENLPQSIKKEMKSTMDHFWDIASWDGIAYQSNGVYVVKIPKTVLKKWGGRFTHEEVEAAVNKYAAYGTYPIIEYTEPETWVTTESGDVLVTESGDTIEII
ncbi:MAG: hypothetical protein NWF07_01975, partial [Candidatus Bathyarchaeota archaeon]|nr:hypothetical protein [Candidatus Bathyarchaeota archaeon]